LTFLLLCLLAVPIVMVATMIAASPRRAASEIFLTGIEWGPERYCRTSRQWTFTLAIGLTTRFLAAICGLVAVGSVLLAAGQHYGLIAGAREILVIEAVDEEVSPIGIREDVYSSWPSWASQTAWETLDAIPVVKVNDLLAWDEPWRDAKPVSARIALFAFRVVILLTTWSLAVQLVSLYREHLSVADE
jgi:hypothetical protein